MIKGWKTVVFGIGVAVLPVLSTIQESSILAELFSNPTSAKIGTSILGILIVVLRAVTTTAIGEKD